MKKHLLHRYNTRSNISSNQSTIEGKKATIEELSPTTHKDNISDHEHVITPLSQPIELINQEAHNIPEAM